MIPDIMEEKIFTKKIPIEAQFELTWRCNQRCIHCYQFPPGDYELTTHQVKDILSQLADAGTLYLSFTGGEPLLREDFWHIARFAFKKHFAILLQTNGLLIDQPTAQRIADLNFFAVHISILGATAETHDAITQTPGSFTQVLRVVGLLRTRGIKVILNLTLMKDNFKEYFQIKALKDSLGADIDIRISPYIFLKNDGGCFPAALRLDDEQLKRFFFDVKKETAGGLLHNKALLCNFGFCVCTINARGEVYPCVAVPVVVGDLKREKFRTVWAEGSILKRIRNTSIADLHECQNCHLADFCFRCSGFSCLENGNLFTCSQESRRCAEIIKEVTEYEEAKV
ncbi:MAG: radical SAM protein [Candidatus Omnitrophica bacterium]|nr:radical SAM protein [Candidatus Omnitrophota bacterium]